MMITPDAKHAATIMLAVVPKEVKALVTRIAFIAAMLVSKLQIMRAAPFRVDPVSGLPSTGFRSFNAGTSLYCFWYFSVRLIENPRFGEQRTIAFPGTIHFFPFCPTHITKMLPVIEATGGKRIELFLTGGL